LDKNIKALREILEIDADKIAKSIDFSTLTNKSIMITGASGLVGINFLAILVKISKQFSDVKIFPIIHSLPSDILRSYSEINGIQFIIGDLTDELFLASLPKADIIIHAAGSGIPSQFLKNKLSSLKINTLTTLKLFEKLNNNGRFLFISSSDIYNGLNANEYSEEQIGITNTDHPRACYIEGKRTGETICKIYQEKGVNAYSVRLSLTYGPGVGFTDDRVLPSFIRKALEGKINLLDSGEASRTLCYISDAIEMMWAILLGGQYSLYNIGGTENIKISELAELIAKKVNVPVTYPSLDSSILGAPKDVKINLSKVLSETKKKDFVSLDKGLENTIKWFELLKNLDSLKISKSATV
jgi:nucleoside-diphosphate-sugar epimerase